MSALKSLSILVLISCVAMLTVLLIPRSAQADEITFAQARELCAKGDVGPLTAYGEFPEESAAKRVVFDWNCMVMVDRKPEEGFEKYVAKDWCDHGHLVTQGQDRCGTFQEAMAFVGRFAHGPAPKDTDKLEFPTMSAVNGQMVTNYGAGVDVFRVVNGKITDHWDASPPRPPGKLATHGPGISKVGNGWHARAAAGLKF